MPLKQFDFSTILGWSVSRFDMFSTCKRQYYYNYYASFDPDHSQEKIHRLKSMTSTALEIGNIVHDVFKILLERLQRNESGINRQKFNAYLADLTDQYCRSKTFAECYYNQRCPEPDMGEILRRTTACFTNFFSSPRYSWIIHKALKSRDRWIIEPLGYGETRIDGLKAYCKVDFLFPVEDRIYIFDWKTGKPNPQKHQKQILGYAAWASYHFGVPAVKINPLIAYLYPEYREMQQEVPDAELLNFSQTVRRETEMMYSFCREVDKNIPREKELFVQNMTKLCHYCNFRELCGISR